MIEKTVEKGIAPKSEVVDRVRGPFEYDDANKLALQTATLLLQSRLSDAIREELGATYASPPSRKPAGIRGPNIACDRLDVRPAHVQSLVQRVFQEVGRRPRHAVH